MADFSFLTDSEDEKAVEDVISQAMDHSVLEQVAAINCSSFSSSSELPPHLESRFRKLKSFPSSASASASSPFGSSKSKSLKPQFNKDEEVNVPGLCDSVKSSDGSRKAEVFKENPDGKRGLEGKTGTGSSSQSDSSTENAEFEGFKRNPDGKKGLEPKSGTRSAYPRSDSSTENAEFDVFEKKPGKKKGFKSKSGSDSWSLSSLESESPSPPQRSGCLWWSPKKKKTVKKGKENRLSSSGVDLDWGKDDEILSGLRTFSLKEQQNLLKKAMKEEEKINREAEKIVKWAKQASARMMDVSGLDDELSDFENNTK